MQCGWDGEEIWGRAKGWLRSIFTGDDNKRYKADATDALGKIQQHSQENYKLRGSTDQEVDKDLAGVRTLAQNVDQGVKKEGDKSK